MLTTANTPELKVVLFDFGGVLLRLHDPVKTFGIGDTPDDFNRRWIHSPSVIAHESGQIDAALFGERIVAEMGLPYSPQEFIRRFANWPDRISADTAGLVQRIPKALDCAILSNTNELHWALQDIPAVFGGRIDRCFLSFETGLIKPEAAAFHQVADAYSCAPPSILFIDDNPVNISAATSAGMRARLCPGVEALESVLAREGVSC